MKHPICAIFLFFFIPSCLSQNILDALRLKEDSIKKYVAGELQSTDTIVDISNDYYEAYYADIDSNKLTVRQAAIFNNTEGSKLLGITVGTWDFVCFQSNTSFYEISKSKKRIKPVSRKVILPQLTYQYFLKDRSLFANLKEDMRKQNLTDADAYDDFETYLKESGIFDIKYSMPRKRTTVTAYIDVCDYYLGNDE